MPENDEKLAIRRKISGPAGPFDAPGVNLAKSMRQAFVRSFEDEIGLELGVPGFSMEKTTLAGIADGIDETDLIFITGGPKDAIGLVVLDNECVAGLLEQMITGRVSPGSATARAPTPTDAAVLSGFLAAVTTRFEAGLAQVSKPPPISGFRTRGILANARAVSLAMEEMQYREIQLTLDLAKGAKTGNLRLIFPWERVSWARTPTAANSWAHNWEQAISRTNTEVEAVLLRLSMSLEEISRLKPGDLVPVPVAAVGQVAITGRDGRRVGQGRLGQSNGCRAVRVSTPAQATAASELAMTVAVPAQRGQQTPMANETELKVASDVDPVPVPAELQA